MLLRVTNKTTLVALNRSSGSTRVVAAVDAENGSQLRASSSWQWAIRLASGNSRLDLALAMPSRRGGSAVETYSGLVAARVQATRTASNEPVAPTPGPAPAPTAAGVPTTGGGGSSGSSGGSSGGTGGGAGSGGGVTDTQSPASPSSLAVSNSTQTSVTLIWQASTDNVGVTAYRLFRGSTAVASVSQLSYTFSGLLCGTSYVLGVEALDAASNVSPRSALTAVTASCPPPSPTLDTTPPSVPQGMSFSARTQTLVSLAWLASTDNVGVVGYHLYRDGVRVASTPLLLYTFSALTCGTSYSFALEAYDAAGNVSNRDAAAGVTTTAACDVTLPPPGGGGGGASVYLSPSGSDAGSCSLAAPCVSFQRAYQVAAPGAVVEVASGTYPSQVIRAVAGKSGPNVVFREAAGGRVVLGGLRFGEGADVAQGPDFITVKGMETSYWGSQPAPLNQEGVSLHPGTTNIVLEDMDAGNFHVWGARDVTIKGGDWGPCYAVWPVSPNVCGNSKIDSWDSGGIRTGNITIDGAYFHDYRFDDSCYAGGADCHWECLYLNASENVTIKNSKFFGCAIFDVFVTFSGPDAVRGHDNLVLENNWFAAPFNEPSYLSSSRTANAVMLSHCEYSPSDGVDHSGLRVRFNSFAGNASVVDDGTSCTTSGGAYAVGNVAAKTGCIAYLSYRSNLFTTGQGQSGVCDASDRNTGQSSAPYVSDSNSAALDHHLAGAIGSSIADNLVPTTTLGGCPSTDLDGQTRASSGNCDAGSDER